MRSQDLKLPDDVLQHVVIGNLRHSLSLYKCAAMSLDALRSYRLVEAKICDLEITWRKPSKRAASQLWSSKHTCSWCLVFRSWMHFAVKLTDDRLAVSCWQWNWPDALGGPLDNYSLQLLKRVSRRFFHISRVHFPHFQGRVSTFKRQFSHTLRGPFSTFQRFIFHISKAEFPRLKSDFSTL